MRKETKLQELERRITQLEGKETQPISHICVSDGLQYLSNPPKWRCRVCGMFYNTNVANTNHVHYHNGIPCYNNPCNWC